MFNPEAVSKLSFAHPRQVPVSEETARTIPVTTVELTEEDHWIKDPCECGCPDMAHHPGAEDGATEPNMGCFHHKECKGFRPTGIPRRMTFPWEK